MDNSLYRKVIVPFRESKDGETSTYLYVTQENNGYGVFLDGCDGQELLKWFPPYEGRDSAIEYGVNRAEELLIERAQKQAA